MRIKSSLDRSYGGCRQRHFFSSTIATIVGSTAGDDDDDEAVAKSAIVERRRRHCSSDDGGGSGGSNPLYTILVAFWLCARRSPPNSACLRCDAGTRLRSIGRAVGWLGGRARECWRDLAARGGWESPTLVRSSPRGTHRRPTRRIDDDDARRLAQRAAHTTTTIMTTTTTTMSEMRRRMRPILWRGI